MNIETMTIQTERLGNAFLIEVVPGPFPTFSVFDDETDTLIGTVGFNSDGQTWTARQATGTAPFTKDRGTDHRSIEQATITLLACR